MSTFHITNRKTKRGQGDIAVVNRLEVNNIDKKVEVANPDDSDALKGIKIIKVVYDVNGVSEPKTMIVMLKAIIDARGRALAAKVKPDIVIAFRGPALRLIQKPGSDATSEQKQIAELVAELNREGAKLEACNFATTVLNLDPAGFFPEVKVVGNTFNSLGGYQAKGYSIISM
jgi:intracellular sulfur oxidation DsrE/DsrF family protein